MHHPGGVKNGTGAATDITHYSTGRGKESGKTPHIKCASAPKKTTYLALERVAGIEPASSAWKAEVIAIIRYPHMVPTTGIELVTY